MRKAGYDDRSVRLDSIEQGVLKLLEVGAANVLKDRLVGSGVAADPIRGLLDPFKELRAQACASGFEKLEGLLNVALRRGAEPDRDHGTGRRSRMRLFTTGQGSDGSSRARRSRRICSTSGEIGTFSSASSAPGWVGWAGAGLGVMGSDYASGAGRASACAGRFSAELSARTFCTFPREFSSFRRRGRPRENEAEPGHGSARLLGRPRDPLLRGRRLQTRGPAGPGGRTAVSTPWLRGRFD